ncbi:LysR substrate-binding domain-containing protein [Acuticoccus kandeliae]|uniref:LysR substrate-binding domain-containing protein n=1 Tax=Acuticoccus kandeliae TaxID=2073160 RepID=UPI000D3E03ED|nr:LysR substrate-binding domain-containing protein [Acuticoccus kandeliae]
MQTLPPLGALRSFEAAARHLSFKKAAVELGVTPTAISHQIKLLERHCGRPLFRRRPRPLALTEAGERLFPVLRDGFATFAETLSTIREDEAGGRLRITATNAFAARWLVPRLPLWRAVHPGLKLDIIGTDAVLDLGAGEADIAIRYARRPPRGMPAVELARDRFHVVASPALVGEAAVQLSPTGLARYPLIEAEWLPGDTNAPTWGRWQREARAHHESVPDLAGLVSMRFREELHAIEAVIAGQGIGICSDVLIGPELASGAVRRLSRIALPGYGFYAVSLPGHPRRAAIAAFVEWALDCAGRAPEAGRDPAAPSPQPSL